MNPTTTAERRRLESLARVELERYQLQRLNSLLNEVLPANSLYAQKFERLKRPVESLAEYAQWPFTFKEELIGPASTGAWQEITPGPRARIRDFIRLPAPAAIPWCCSIRLMIGDGSWNAGNMCWMAPALLPTIGR